MKNSADGDKIKLTRIGNAYKVNTIENYIVSQTTGTDTFTFTEDMLDEGLNAFVISYSTSSYSSGGYGGGSSSTAQIEVYDAKGNGTNGSTGYSYNGKLLGVSLRAAQNNDVTGASGIGVLLGFKEDFVGVKIKVFGNMGLPNSGSMSYNETILKVE